MNNKLNKKYWLAETSTTEEHRLKQEAGNLSEEERSYFNMLHQFSELKLDEAFQQKILAVIEDTPIVVEKKITWNTYRSIAATVLLFVTAGSIYWSIQQQQRILASELAFEEAKSALLLMSSQLNKGTSSTYTISKFSATAQKINNKN